MRDRRGLSSGHMVKNHMTVIRERMEGYLKHENPHQQGQRQDGGPDPQSHRKVEIDTKKEIYEREITVLPPSGCGLSDHDGYGPDLFNAELFLGADLCIPEYKPGQFFPAL